MPPSPNKQRIESIDLLRGLIMIIMALDHTRDYFHHDSMLFDPTDIQKTYGFLFFTRWITHLCAPLFVFLSGISAFLSGRTKSKKELSLFLLKRGIWLILLEMTVVNFAWFANPSFTFFIFGVLWALGISMIFLAGFVFLPKNIVLLIGFILIGGHNLLDGIKISDNSLSSFLWAICHQRHAFEYPGIRLGVMYPCLPWIGLMAIGYSMGVIFTNAYTKAQRTNFLATAGLSCISLFVLLRMTNSYGDLLPWSKQSSTELSFLSFMNLTKYPPSLDYLLATVGIGLLFLAFTEKPFGRPGKVIAVFGRVPLFFYILHLYAIHFFAIIAAVLQGFKWTDMVSLHGLPPSNPIFKTYGLSLGGTYLVWILIVIGLYPLCKWYDSYKTSHKEKRWLSYL